MTEVLEIAHHFMIIVLSLGVVAAWFEITQWISRK